MRIRVATNTDRVHVRKIHLCSFPEGENQDVAMLAVNLLGEETNPETFALVAESDGVAVGHVAFSPVFDNRNGKWIGYILAPLSVKPEFRNRGIGSALIKNGLELLSEKGSKVLFVYGDPKYYGKFGFSAEAATGYSPPYKLRYPFGWQAITLNKAVSVKSPVKIACVTSLQDQKLW